jgi:N-acetylglucosaminyldiphosphoundecaprenol N-acetyl-beta-D-mannosaminyltransferase
MNTMHRQVGILGAYIDYVTLDEAVQRTTEFVADGSPHQVVTVNVDFIRLAQQDREFMSIINRSDLAIADGMPLVWASGWVGDRLPERVTGVELVQKCCELAAQEGYRVFLLGGEDGVAQGAAGILTERCPNLQVVGTYSPPFGPFSEEEDRKMVDMIREARPHILFVAFGAPKQDMWIAQHRDELQVPLAVGVGGVFNFLTGRVSRAPQWMQEHGLEWFYRVVQEPKRLWRRYFLHDLPIVARMAMEGMRVRSMGVDARRATRTLPMPLSAEPVPINPVTTVVSSQQ